MRTSNATKEEGAGEGGEVRREHWLQTKKHSNSDRHALKNSV